MILRVYSQQKKGIKVFNEEYHTRITVIIRKDNSVLAPMIPTRDYGDRALWSVKFIPSGVPSLLMSTSVAFVHSHPKLFDSILFPKQGYKYKTLPNVQNGMFLLLIIENDPMLNDDQNLFIKRVLQRTALAFNGYEKDSELDIPNLLVGPFGTGKTMTFVKTLKQICNRFVKSRILAIAPSQSAADTIALKLLSIGMDVNTIFRFNHPLRDIYSIPWELMKISHINLDSFAFPDNLFDFSIVICTTVEAQLLVHWKFTNLDISKGRNEVIDGVNEQLQSHGLPSYECNDYEVHWTHLAGI